MLAVEGVVAGYGASTVLHGVDLVVPPSSVVALVGANGAGKTTLLRVASGLLPPRAGRILLDGEDRTGAHPFELVARGVCHVPEGRGVFPALSVRENLVMQARTTKASEQIERAIDAFPRLGERLHQAAGTLSGGEQQMLAVARAYVQRPRVVLLDEVSMGLAPRIVDEIYEFLAILAADGVSLLLVEQYVTRALERADYVYLMNRGRIAFAGEPGELDETDVFREYIGVAS